MQIKYRDKQRRLYLIVGYDLPGCTKHGIRCKTVKWENLLPRGRQETRMERDLYDCIAKFGIPGFYTRHMKISQLGKAVATAVKCVPQLKTVCAEAGLRPDGKPDINEDHLGIYVKTAPPKEQPGGPHAQLALLRRKRSQRLAWIGYERSENDGLVPVVYLYCSERYAPRVAQNLKSQFKSNLKRWGNDFAVYKDPAITQEDRKWFVGVVRRLVELAQRQRSHTKS